jgi:hypothetical protein
MRDEIGFGGDACAGLEFMRVDPSSKIALHLTPRGER